MLGYGHEEFWDQTPRTLSLTFEANSRRAINDHNGRAWIAWHTAALGKVKKFPRLQALMAKQQTHRETLDQQLEGLKNWVTATGGKVIYKQ